MGAVDAQSILGVNRPHSYSTSMKEHTKALHTFHRDSGEPPLGQVVIFEDARHHLLEKGLGLGGGTLQEGMTPETTFRVWQYDDTADTPYTRYLVNCSITRLCSPLLLYASFVQFPIGFFSTASESLQSDAFSTLVKAPVIVVSNRTVGNVAFERIVNEITEAGATVPPLFIVGDADDGRMDRLQEKLRCDLTLIGTAATHEKMLPELLKVLKSLLPSHVEQRIAFYQVRKDKSECAHALSNIDSFNADSQRMLNNLNKTSTQGLKECLTTLEKDMASKSEETADGMCEVVQKYSRRKNKIASLKARVAEYETTSEEIMNTAWGKRRQKMTDDANELILQRREAYEQLFAGIVGSPNVEAAENEAAENIKSKPFDLDGVTIRLPGGTLDNITQGGKIVGGGYVGARIEERLRNPGGEETGSPIDLADTAGVSIATSELAGGFAGSFAGGLGGAGGLALSLNVSAPTLMCCSLGGVASGAAGGAAAGSPIPVIGPILGAAGGVLVVFCLNQKKKTEICQKIRLDLRKHSTDCSTVARKEFTEGVSQAMMAVREQLPSVEALIETLNQVEQELADKEEQLLTRFAAADRNITYKEVVQKLAAYQALRRRLRPHAQQRVVSQAAHKQ